MSKKKLVILTLLTFMLSSCNKSLFMKYIEYDNKDLYHVIGTYGEQYQAVTSIDISWVKGKVNIVESEEYDYLTIIEKTNEVYSEKYLCHVYNEQESSSLFIKYCESGISLPNTYSKNLEVYVPSSMPMKNINIYLSTSSLNLSDISVETLSIKNVSGTVNVSSITASSLSYDGVSGAFTCVISDIIKDIDIAQVSGKTILSLPSSIKGYQIDVSTVSGKYNSDFDDVQVETMYNYLEKDIMNVVFASVSGSLSIVKN